MLNRGEVGWKDLATCQPESVVGDKSDNGRYKITLYTVSISHHNRNNKTWAGFKNYENPFNGYFKVQARWHYST